MIDFAFVIESMGSGGAQQVLVRIAEALLAEKKAVALITFRPACDDRLSVPNGVCRIVLGEIARGPHPFGGVIANIARIRRLRKAVVSCKAKNVVAMVGTTNILTILATIGLSVRVIISERNDPSRQSLGRGWDALRVLLYRKADLVTANSLAAVKALGSYVPKAKVTYLPNPVRTAPTTEVAPKFGPTILAVGRLHEQKNYAFLIDAFAQFSKQFPHWRLRLVGEGPLLQSLTELGKKLGICEKLEFTGHCEDPFPHYRACDLFVTVSHFEGTPNALLEAMSLGVPSVVSSGLPGALALIDNGINGLHFQEGSLVELVSSLRRLAEDESLRKRLGSVAAAHRALDVGFAIAAWKRALFCDASAD